MDVLNLKEVGYIKEDNLQEKPGLKQLFENLLNVFEQRYDEVKTNKEKRYITAKDIIDGFSDFMRVWGSSCFK